MGEASLSGVFALKPEGWGKAVQGWDGAGAKALGPERPGWRAEGGGQVYKCSVNPGFFPLYYRYVCCAKSLQVMLTLCNLLTVVLQAPLSMGFSRQEYWSGALPDPGIEPGSPVSPALQVDS